MKMVFEPEGFAERIGMAMGMVPTPMGDTWCAQKLARWIMAAAKLGIFDALATEDGTAVDVARRAGTDAGATQKLLGLLVTAGYVRHRASATR